jgi:altronate dehydratase small subunit
MTIDTIASESRCFRVTEADNVATMLEDVASGQVRICGANLGKPILAREPIALGHKIAVTDIKYGELIVKYGVPIAVSTRSIMAGELVHLHNCRSRVDERSSRLDPNSGEAKDTPYV